MKAEASGRKPVANTGVVEAAKLSVRPEDLTGDQLKKLLADKKLHRERKNSCLTVKLTL